jgi:glycosyltransferase involved in cell wall biosynthesis
MPYGPYPSILLVSERHADRSQEFRMHIYEEMLFRRGIMHRFEVLPEVKAPSRKGEGLALALGKLVSSTVQRARQRTFDIIVLHGVPRDEFGTKILYRHIPFRRQGVLLIVDIDREQSHHNSFLLRRADHVLLSSPALSVQQEASSSDYVATSIDTVYYSPRHLVSDRDNDLILGIFLLCQEEADALEAWLPLLKELAIEDGSILSLLISEGVKVSYEIPIPHRRAAYVGDVRSVISVWDVALIIPSTFSQGVYHHLLTVMALGIPLIAPLLPYRTLLLEHEKHGVLYTTQEELREWLGRLFSDTALRRRLGVQGRHQVVRNFSREGVFLKWLEVLQGVYAQSVTGKLGQR